MAGFVAAVAGRDDPVWVGIDPGVSGALAFVCGDRFCAVDVPQAVRRVRRRRRLSPARAKAAGRKTRTVAVTEREADLGAVAALFRLLEPLGGRLRFALERVPPTVGRPGRAYAEVRLNRAYAMWPLFLAYLGHPVVGVSPADWKRTFGLRRSDKDASRAAAARLFPGADVARKKDHNRAEALLLAEYLRRHWPAAARPSDENGGKDIV